MKKPSRQAGEAAETKPGLELFSLVPVSVLLRMDSIATSTLPPDESGLGLRVDPPVTGTPLQVPAFEIALQADGSIVGNEEFLDLDVTNRELPQPRERLRVYKEASDLLDSTPAVSLSAEDSAHGRCFVDVSNRLANLEIDRVNLSIHSAPQLK